MSQLVTDNLPMVAGTESGVQLIRDLILDLAVRGRLCPQDRDDEPATELLSRVRSEKARKASGVAKSANPASSPTANGRPFNIPESWLWARLGDLTELVTSGSRDWAKHYADQGAIFVRMGNLSKKSYRLRLDNIQRVSPPNDGEGRRTKLEAADLLISITGDVGLLGLIPEGFGEAFINQHTCLVRFAPELRNRYFPEALRSPLAHRQYQGPQRGIKNSFRLSDVTEIEIPVPPLAEQHRIVAKVDELMALCDNLETEQGNVETAHARLVEALLGALTQAQDHADFANSWKLVAEYFHELFTTEKSISTLKQTLLQLAVKGVLVEQNKSELPIGLFLDQQKIPNVESTLAGWGTASLGSLGPVLGGSTPSKTNQGYWTGDIPWVSPKDMKRTLVSDSEDHVTDLALRDTSLKPIPAGSLLMVVRGMILAHSFPVAVGADRKLSHF